MVLPLFGGFVCEFEFENQADHKIEFTLMVERAHFEFRRPSEMKLLYFFVLLIVSNMKQIPIWLNFWVSGLISILMFDDDKERNKEKWRTHIDVEHDLSIFNVIDSHFSFDARMFSYWFRLVFLSVILEHKLNFDFFPAFPYPHC